MRPLSAVPGDSWPVSDKESEDDMSHEEMAVLDGM
jgi:hypothetical protein